MEEKERANAWQGRFERALEGETLTLRERRGKGTWEISVFPIRVDGQIRFAGGMAREITPWNTAEHELRHTVHEALKAHQFERAVDAGEIRRFVAGLGCLRSQQRRQEQGQRQHHYLDCACFHNRFLQCSD